MTQNSIVTEPPDVVSARDAEIRAAWFALFEQTDFSFGNREKILRYLLRTFRSSAEARSWLETALQWVEPEKGAIETEKPHQERSEMIAVASSNSTEAIHADWDYAWSLIEKPSFARENAGRYVAVYLQESFGAEVDSDELRNRVVATLSTRGLSVDPRRIVLAYVEPF